MEKLFTRNLNLNATIDDIYELFGLTTTEYLCSNTYVEMLLNSNSQSRGLVCGISVREFNNEIKNGYAKLKTFPCSGSREILHYVNPILESGNYDTAVLHFRVNELTQKALSKSDTVENLIQNIRKVAVKCTSHEVPKVFVSVIVRNKRIPELVLEQVKKEISFIKNNDFIFVDNSNISNVYLFATFFTWLNRVDVFLQIILLFV